MNDLAIALIWLSVQVTAVALAGLGLSAAAARGYWKPPSW